MKRILTYIMLIVAMAMTCSCDRRDLYENYGGNLMIDITIVRQELGGILRGEIPTGMTATFFDPETHQSSALAPLSATGGFVTVNPGNYNVLLYNYNTEYTVLRHEETYHQVEAHTNEVPNNVRRSFDVLVKALAAARAENSRGYADDPVIQEPDHLYVGKITDLDVPASYSKDNIKHVAVEATPLVEVYDYHIATVNGMEFIQSAEVFITGQVQSRMLHDRSRTGVPCTLYKPIMAARSNFFAGSFTTFGNDPDEDNFLVLRIVTFDNQVATWEWDISDQIASGDHYIEVNTNIDVPVPPTSGGFIPEISDWEGNIITNIVL